jgi:hypothetical protein
MESVALMGRPDSIRLLSAVESDKAGTLQRSLSRFLETRRASEKRGFLLRESENYDPAPAHHFCSAYSQKCRALSKMTIGRSLAR